MHLTFIRSFQIGESFILLGIKQIGFLLTYFTLTGGRRGRVARAIWDNLTYRPSAPHAAANRLVAAAIAGYDELMLPLSDDRFSVVLIAVR
jgi:hypothetical protein